jgi:hypothetical protein
MAMFDFSERLCLGLAQRQERTSVATIEAALLPL